MGKINFTPKAKKRFMKFPLALRINMLRRLRQKLSQGGKSLTIDLKKLKKNNT